MEHLTYGVKYKYQPGKKLIPPSTATPEILELLDNMGLNVVLHTHHPLTHLEYGTEVPTNPFANTRNECPESPMALLPGGGMSK